MIRPTCTIAAATQAGASTLTQSDSFWKAHIVPNNITATKPVRAR